MQSSPLHNASVILALLISLADTHAFGLTLAEAFRAAEASSQIKTLAVEESKLKQTQSAVEQAQSGLLPQVAATASYVRVDSADPDRADQSTVKLSITQNLFRGGRDQEAIKVAESIEAAQQARVEAARLSLYQQVADAYFQAHATAAELKSLMDLKAVVEKRMSDIRARIRIGRSRLGEQLTAESQIALLVAQIEKARDDAQASTRSLATLMGVSVDSLTIEVKRPDVPNPAPLSEYLAGLQKRVDLRAMEQDLESTRAAIKLARSEDWPSVDLAANYYLVRPQPQQDVKWDVGLALTVPLYAGGATSAKIRAQAEKAIEKQLLLDNARLTAANEMTLVHARVLSLKAQVRAYDEAIRISDKNFQEQSRDYQLGLQSSLEVLQALNSLQENRRSRDKTFFQLLTNFQRLEALTGRLP